jgi:AcrR family transcriptional regulator
MPRRASNPSPSRRAPSLSQEDRRNEILDAAIPLLVQHGRDVTTKQIAEAAGIAEGTIFRVFPDKRALCKSAVARYMDPETIRAGLQGIDPDLPLEEKVRRVVVMMRARFAGIMGIMTALGMADHGHHRGLRGRPPAHDRAQMEGLLAGLLEAEHERLRMDANTAAHLIRLLVFASEIPAFNDPHSLTTDELVDFIMRGIARDGA